MNKITSEINIGRLMIMTLYLESSMMKSERNNSKKKENKISYSMEKIVIKICLLPMFIDNHLFLTLQNHYLLLSKLLMKNAWMPKSVID